MAVQDQQKDALLNARPTRRRRVGWLWCVLGGVVCLMTGGVVAVTPAIVQGQSSSTHRASSGVFGASELPLQASYALPASEHAGSEALESAEARARSESVAKPGMNPPARAYHLTERELRRRIEQVESGQLAAPPDSPTHASQRGDVVFGPPAIVVENERMVVRPSAPSAGLEVDERSAPSGKLVLDLRSGDACVIEAPVSGAGLMVDGTYLPPGQSRMVGTGSTVQVTTHTGIHIRPVVGPLRISGAG